MSTKPLQSQESYSSTEIDKGPFLASMAPAESIQPNGAGIRLLTFNTWGLKLVSKHRKARLHAIADKIALDDAYDVIALQEVWCKSDWDYLVERCGSKFPYNRVFYSGILSGPGLAVLSKLPIESTFLYRFPINGRPSAFFRGDWYVGKSVAVTILKTASSGSIALLNSHMHAPYALSGDAAYSCHRACQAWDFSQIASLLQKAGYAVIVVGDLNSRPGSLPHRIFEFEAGLQDSWELLHGRQPLEYPKSLSPEDQIRLAGATCDSTLNTWRADRQPTEACRLDYALVDARRIIPIGASVEFTESIPGIGSYSDHFAYSLRFKVDTRSRERPNGFAGDRAAVHADLMQEVQTYINTTCKWQSNWRYWHAALSILVVIAFHPVIVVVSFIAPWASILFQFFSILIALSGVLNGFIALLFGRSEKRALMEVLQEVEDRQNAQ
ncbi:unnamed protein product [Kuraishia capsulata CBS 1993]|uniref:Endonuclease/exonuclease/phosphatase domain-containing protein n=1 Tax=Kuraishia capsulata CBS 1993 TaxID=1382522 RepID=W6MY54_9ASCO|nr:uncharacterized protein KUCA_T00006035001 [Kuraishia capsulata CBS 1993]CDK30040.1 unnamed protein product [Kuraishia capsulata CBS 1993]